jgi:hypothetical protein
LTSHLEDAAKIPSIPENVAPKRCFESIVERQGAFLSDYFGEAIEEAVVAGCKGLILETDFE